MIVDLTGATSTSNFDLFGNVVDSGAYEYALHQGADNNWYLQSNGRATGTAKMVAAVPSLHYSIIRTGQNELRKRLGQLRGNNHRDKNGTWVRTYAKNMNISENSDSKMNLYGFEAGYDHLVHFDCDNKIYAGIMAGYLYTDNIKNKVKTSGSASSTAHANTPSIGLYATWINYDGWFSDATLREFFSDMKVNSTTSQGQKISYDSKRNFTSASFEFGKEISYHLDGNSKFIFEPKAEVQYFTSKAKSFKTKEFNNNLEYDKTQSLTTRAALMAGYKQRIDNKNIIEPFIEAGYSYEWDGKTDVKYAGSNFNSDLSGGTYDIGVGVNFMNTSGWNLYTDVTYENGSIIEAFSGNIGARYTW